MAFFKLVDNAFYQKDKGCIMIPSVHNCECTICANCIGNSRRKFVTKLTCGHVFHPKCINRWLVSQLTCPNCRYKIYQRIPNLPLTHSFHITPSSWVLGHHYNIERGGEVCVFKS